jgi:hypothetical protein
MSNAGRLVVETREATGNWSAIGISTQPAPIVNLFSTWIEHSRPFSPLSYSILPGLSHQDFVKKHKKLQLETLQNDDNVSAMFDAKHKVVMAIFWSPSGGTVTFSPKGSKGSKGGSVTLIAQDNIALIYKVEQRQITVSDPSQSLTSTVISLSGWGLESKSQDPVETKTITIQFPGGGMAGKGVTQSID